MKLIDYRPRVTKTDHFVIDGAPESMLNTVVSVLSFRLDCLGDYLRRNFNSLRFFFVLARFISIIYQSVYIMSRKC